MIHKKAERANDKRDVMIMLPAFVVEALERLTKIQNGQLRLNIHRGTIGSIDIK